MGVAAQRDTCEQQNSNKTAFKTILSLPAFSHRKKYKRILSELIKGTHTL